MKRPASEEGYELTLDQSDGLPVEVAPTPEPQSPGEWIQRNLFSSTGNTILTIVAGGFVVWALVKILGFVFVEAEWLVVKDHLRVYMIGRFPLEEVWRIWVSLYVLALMVGLTKGVLRPGERTVRRLLRVAILAGGLGWLLVSLVESSLVLMLVAGGIGTIAVGVVIGRLLGRRLTKVLTVAWVLVFPFVIFMLRGMDGVKPDLWGGFMLNLVVAFVAIFASFPIGVLLALGRRSTLPVVRTICVGFIEFIRGVPLVVLIVFGIFALPLFLPPGTVLPNIVKAMIMYSIFSAAYVAEITRGGLQGVAEGQYEAAKALGLPTLRMMTLIILPQALRNTIPAMISHFISLFKDTALLAVALGLFSDLLQVASRATRINPYIGHDTESLLAAAAIFWSVAFSMSRWSQRVERRVGVGER